MFNNVLVYFGYILGIEIMFGTSSFLGFWMFRVLSDIHLGLGSVWIIFITRNTIKQDPFGIYVGFGSFRDLFLSYWIRFEFSGSVYLPNPKKWEKEKKRKREKNSHEKIILNTISKFHLERNCWKRYKRSNARWVS